MPTYEWYEIVQGSEVRQGDILEGVDIYLAVPYQEGRARQRSEFGGDS